MKSGRARRVVIGVVVAVVLLLVTAAVIMELVWYLPSESRRRGVHAQTIRELLAAKSVEDREKAAGDGGVVLNTPSGGWVVIAYRDSHHQPAYSDAVIMTSDGRWFHSTEHFCGRFSIYGNQRALRAAPAEMVERGEVPPPVEGYLEGKAAAELAEIERAADMGKVGELLKGMGFEEMEKPE